MQRESRRDENGKLKFDGIIIWEKGDSYFTDCSVTGCNPGTDDDPKFPLHTVFEEQIFPLLEELVMCGGKYEGYIPIIQGDQAGPHEEVEFVRYMRSECSRRGWCFEPQSPQSPHMNNLDLVVFPAMSARHSHLSRKQRVRVCKKEEVWRNALEVWEELPSSLIARGFVQVSRLAKKVIQSKGSNDFLRSKGREGLSCKINKDFYNTEDGIARKDGQSFEQPLLTRQSMLFETTFGAVLKHGV